MPTFTTNQKIALAVSVPVAGILFYFLLKWAREDDEFEDDVNAEDEFVSSADLVSELQIPQCHVGAIIGRGGSVIKQIQKESETRINLKDYDESGDELTEEAKPQIRTMVIRGLRERIKHAEVLIKKLIDEQPVLEKVVVEIPERVIGRIIGKGGKTIRQLCRISGARIKIDQDNDTREIRTCDIVGTKTQIECAKQLIDEKIAEDKEFRATKRSTQEAKDKLTFAHLPVHGDYFGVYVSAMDTPGHFWIQNITKNAKQLDELVEEMTQFYGDKGQGHMLIPPKIGDLCCATFQHDVSWYRSEIVQVMEDRSEVQVQYLDFGDTDVVSMSYVKEIRKEFCDLPFQAIECYLANVKPNGESWSREACDAFEKLSCCAQWKVLMARVMYYDDNGVPCIELIDTNTDDDVNIEKKLVEQGFAVYKEEASNKETDDNSKTSNSSFQSSEAAVDQIIAEQKEIALEQMNEEFRTPAFENVSFDMDRSESFEFSSPTTTRSQDNDRLNDKEIVNEPTIAPVEHQIVSCADISKLESLFGMLNVDTSMTDGAETDGIFDNLIEEPDSDDSESTPKETQEGSVRNMLDNSDVERDISDNLIQEQRLETGEENIQIKQENFDPTASNQLSRNLDENVNSEAPITSSVNVQENFMEPITISNVQFTEGADFTPDEDILSGSTMEMLNDDNQKPVLNDELSMNKDMNKDISNLSLTNDHPITSTPEYHPNRFSETNLKSTSANQEEDVSVPDNGLDRADYVLRRSCSEDLTTDDTLTDGSLIKSSSEITVSSSKYEKINTEQDSKNQLSSRGLGSLSSGTPKGGKRVLAANFGQILNNGKQESDDGDDSDDDDESLYLSAKEDSDSTGFLSAIGSRINLRNDEFDTDSDATPSGYLSEPEDNSIEIVEDQTRFDTTLLVERLEQYADK